MAIHISFWWTHLIFGLLVWLWEVLESARSDQKHATVSINLENPLLLNCPFFCPPTHTHNKRRTEKKVGSINMILCASPDPNDFDETVNTMKTGIIFCP
jgi:hypothetical protein